MGRTRLLAFVAGAASVAAVATFTLAAVAQSGGGVASVTQGTDPGPASDKIAILAEKERSMATQGPGYATSEEASSKQSVPVPRCPGANAYNSPSPGTVWVHFETQDLKLAISRNAVFDLTRQLSAEHVAYQEAKIGDLPGLVMSWDGLFTITTRPDGSVGVRGGIHKTILEWNFGGAGLRMWSDSLSSSELVDLAARCTYPE